MGVKALPNSRWPTETSPCRTRRGRGRLARPPSTILTPMLKPTAPVKIAPPQRWPRRRFPLCGSENSATMRRASSTASGEGEKMRLAVATWLGWISVLPSNPIFIPWQVASASNPGWSRTKTRRRSIHRPSSTVTPRTLGHHHDVHQPGHQTGALVAGEHAGLLCDVVRAHNQASCTPGQGGWTRSQSRMCSLCSGTSCCWAVQWRGAPLHDRIVGRGGGAVHAAVEFTTFEPRAAARRTRPRCGAPPWPTTAGLHSLCGGEASRPSSTACSAWHQHDAHQPGKGRGASCAMSLVPTTRQFRRGAGLAHVVAFGNSTASGRQRATASRSNASSSVPTFGNNSIDPAARDGIQAHGRRTQRIDADDDFHAARCSASCAISDARAAALAEGATASSRSNTITSAPSDQDLAMARALAAGT